MSVVLFLLHLAFFYGTYYNSQRYKANPYLWTAIGTTGIFGFAASILYFRKKPVVNPKPSPIPLGFRSKRPWKAAVAIALYTMFIFVSFAAFTAKPTASTLQSDLQGSSESQTVTSSNISESTATPAPGQTSSNASSNSNTTGTVNGLLRVHYINVGQGDSELIQQGNKNMLIDTGTNASTSSLISYLMSQNISKIDYLVLTHPHEDHIGGADAVINGFDIGTVYMPKVTTTTTTFKDVVTAMNNKGLKAQQPALGATFKLGDANCTVLGPVDSESGDLNI